MMRMSHADKREAGIEIPFPQRDLHIPSGGALAGES